mgnify:CR=1 FL=1
MRAILYVGCSIEGMINMMKSKLTIVKKYAVLMMTVIVCLCMQPFAMTVQASQPKVMVVDCKIVQKEIIAGQTFDLAVTIKNTGSRYVDNLKISVTSDTGDIVPAEGAGNGFLEELPNGEESTFTFRLRAADGLAEKSYKLSVVNEYDDIWGNPYSATDVIYLPVKLEQRASITDLYVDDDAVLGDSVEVIGSVNNMGAGMLYNVRVRVESNYLEENDTFIGNIDTGKSGSIDILTNASATTSETGELSNVVVTYEDKEGNETELTGKFKVTVNSPVYDNVEKIKDTTTKINKNIIIAVCIAVILIVALIAGTIRRNKRKKRILEEFYGVAGV